MDNLNDLKEIWLSADTTAVPDAAEMMRAIRKYRSTRLAKKAVLILAAILLTGILVMVVFMYKSDMVSTRIGEACMIAAGLMLVFTNIRSIGRLYRIKDHANKEFLHYLEQVQVNRIYYYRKTQVVAFTLVSVGLLLYIYEMAYRYPMWGAAGYSFVIVYILVMWLIVRPRAYKRQAKKLEETINKMKRLADQF